MLQLWENSRQRLEHVPSSIRSWHRCCHAAWADKRHWIWPPIKNLPVAGINSAAAQAALFKMMTEQQQEEGAVHCWLHALQLLQAASDRLLHDLDTAHRSLRFWQLQLAAGGHGTFMLLRRGPVQFAREVLVAAGLRPAAGEAADRIQEKVLALQALTKLLATALGEVHTAAGQLRTVCSAGSGGRGKPLQVEQAALLHSCSSAVCRVTAALQELHVAAHAWKAPASNSSSSGSTQPPGAISTACKPSTSLPGLQVQLQELQQLLQDPGALSSRRSSAGAAASSSSHSLPQCLQLGVLEQPAQLGCSAANGALRRAHVVATCLDPLLPLPRWLRMPSHWQRHWIKYVAAAGCTFAAVSWVVRHSRVCGSGDLDRWVQTAVTTAADSWQVHVVEPLVAVRDEMFKTFRERPSILSLEEYANDKDTLLRMLAAFKTDSSLPAAASQQLPPAGTASTTPTANTTAPKSTGGPGSNLTPSPPPAAGAAGSQVSSSAPPAAAGAGGGAPAADAEMAAITSGMAVVMSSYEGELRHPIRNLVAGDLARSLLIQVQRLKLDTESALLELDQILRANELSISLVAAVPSLLLMGLGLQALGRLLLRGATPDTGAASALCRLAAIQLGQVLLSVHLEGTPGSPATPQAAAAAGGGGASPQQQQPSKAQQGLVVYQVNLLYQALQRAYRLIDVHSKTSEWPLLLADVLLLANPEVPVASKLAVQQHMLTSFKVLQSK